MLITDKFIFITMPKTGWTFTKNHLQGLYSNKLVQTYYCDIPKKDQNKFKFGNVRNPWSYYVSWYSYQKQINGKILKVFLNGQPNTFDNFIRGLMNNTGYSAGNKSCEDFIESRTHILNKNSLKYGTHIQDRKIGLLTWYYVSYYFKNCQEILINQKYDYDYILDNYDNLFDLNFTCKIENLNNDIVKALKKCKAPLNETQESNIKRAQKVNVSKHKHYTEYYTDETMNLVAERDKLIIDKHNYRFEK